MPGPIGISNGAKIIVIAKLRRPGRPRVELSTRHRHPERQGSMGLRALRRTSLMCSVFVQLGVNRLLSRQRRNASHWARAFKDGPTKARSW